MIQAGVKPAERKPQGLSASLRSGSTKRNRQVIIPTWQDQEQPDGFVLRCLGLDAQAVESAFARGTYNRHFVAKMTQIGVMVFPYEFRKLTALSATGPVSQF